MRPLTLLFSLLFVCAMASLAGSKYTEHLIVQVFDQNYRTVEGAEVYVNYQLNSMNGFVNTKPKATNQTGEADVLFTNYEEIDPDTDRTYTLYVKYGNGLYSSGMIADNYTNISSVVPVRRTNMEVKAYLLSVNVVNQERKPLPARVTVNKKTLDTDLFGRVFFQLPPNNYTVSAEANGAVRSQFVALSQDNATEVEIGLYSLLVHVIDDKKKPLVAMVEIDGVSKPTGPDGSAIFHNITSSTPEIVVGYNNTYKHFSPNLKLEPTLNAVFDLNTPFISELHVAVSRTGVGAINLFAEDRGASASGIDTVLVSYEIDGVTSTVPAYSVGYNTFEAKIPSQPARTLVKYAVKVADKDGNTAMRAGSYVIADDEVFGQNGSSNGTVTPGGSDIPSFLGKINIETVIIGLAVGTIVAYAIFYYFTRSKKGGVSPPPHSSQPHPPATPPS